LQNVQGVRGHAVARRREGDWLQPFTNLAEDKRENHALERGCPEYVDQDRWQQAIADGRCFLAQWNESAAGLGWSARDLFGLAEIPDGPGSNYQRLSRYDQTGLIWLLQGRPVVALTSHTAVIETTTGTLAYRRHDKPALGPLGDSLDDMGAC
jgi:hypothetical protein